MSGTLRITLKTGERVFINGAILRADRKVSVELLNDASFLLEQHVMNIDDATTPLRQLYYVTQQILLDPQHAQQRRDAALHVLRFVEQASPTEEVSQRLAELGEIIAKGRAFDALKLIRLMFRLEEHSVETSGERPADR